MTPVRRLASEIEKLELMAVGRVLLLSSIVGVVAGGGAILFQVLCQGASHLFLGQWMGYRPPGPVGEAELFPGTGTGALQWWLIPVIPAVGGLIAGLIVSRFAPEAGGHGTDDAIDAFHRRKGVIRGRVPIVKTIASAITLGSGGSGGREGPIAQIGAGFGSFLATRLRLSDRERRILLAAGMGAGVGSIFRAPLAGALFAAEVLYSNPEFESEAIIPAAISSIIAYCVFSIPFGFGALFDTPRFAFHSAFELVPYTALALIVALAAGLFVRVFYGVHALFERWRIPAPLKPMIGGFLTGGLALAIYAAGGGMRSLDVLSFGYGSIQQAMLGNMSVTLLLLVAVGKLLTCSFSIGSGGSGGVFGPSMVIGGTLGGAVGIAAQYLMPDIVTQPAAFVPVGMAGFFAAAANTPISTLIMVSEMTGNYHLLLPALWVCALAYLIGRRWLLYRHQVPAPADSPAHRGTIFGSVLRGLRVRDVASDRTVHVLSESMPLQEVLREFMRRPQSSFPVVDAEGLMTGSITLEQVREHLDKYGERVPVIAHDIAAPPQATLSPEDGLDVALQRMLSLDTEELPIARAEAPRRVIGLLSRRDILAAYDRHRAEANPAPPA
jgi:CIC family chloride channel protein